MAAEEEGRTEEPSEYKLEKARKEGRVAKSQEIGSALVLLFIVVMLIFLSKWIFNQLLGIMNFYFSRTGTYNLDNPGLFQFFLEVFVKCVFPLLLISAVVSVAANIIQTKGFIFSLKPIEPKFSKIVPKVGEYLKKTIFSAKGLFNVAKSIGKVAIICFVGFLFIKKDVFILCQIIKSGQIFEALKQIAMMAAQILIVVAVIFLIISIPDYFIQKKLDSMENTIVFKMPLFAPTNNIFLAHKGPKIPLKFKMVGNISNNLRTEVKNYGINNALITAYLDIIIECSVILPITYENIKINQTVTLAMKVIQGKIPNYYMPTKN